jgi:hypothetical protein
MDNLTIYNACRAVPREALKEIQAGRLKGKSDINPMWRLKCLTEQFGPCGIGWKYVITKQWLEHGGNDEIAAFVNIDLHIKVNGEWSEAIPGTGGSSFVAKERNGLYVSDECFKMALTDAISVSCKALGFGANVYWSADSTKYSRNEQQVPQGQRQQQVPQNDKAALIDDKAMKALHALASEKGLSHDDLSHLAQTQFNVDSLKKLTIAQSRELYKQIKSAPEEQAGA